MNDTALPRAIYLAIAGAVALTVGGGAAFWYASQHRAIDAAPADQQITVNATACVPNAVTVPGGRRSFEIINASDRPVEWEIVDGVMVVAERENIAPGFRATLEVQLAPGTYAMACGLLSNPRGTLTVTASDEATAAASSVTLRKFLGPLSEYRVYLAMQGAQAVKTATALEQAIAAGDLDGARTAWAAARLPYRRIEPLAYRFSDLENRIDPSAAYLAGREDDAGFLGYHRIEYGLFSQDSTDGLLPVAQALVADLTVLAARLKQQPLDPALLVGLPGDMARRLAESQVPEGENAYAGDDLAEFGASLDGIAKVTGLLAQVVGSVDPALDREITDQMRASYDALANMQAMAPARYADVPVLARQKLADDLKTLAATLARLQPVIGMN